MPEPLLAVSGLSVSYGPIVAVRDLDLEVSDGEVVALLGPNGAGKSSTLRALVGLTPCSADRMELGGVNLRGARIEARVRLGMALAPEGRQVFDGLTVAENLRLGGAISDRDAAHEIETEVAQLFPILQERRNQLAGTLSGGQQQQLAIARALMSRPRLLLLDEPSLGLAPRIVDDIFELIATLRDRGMTIILVEQNVSRALDVANRGYVLESGRLVLSGPVSELRAAEDQLVGAYLGLEAEA